MLNAFRKYSAAFCALPLAGLLLSCGTGSEEQSSTTSETLLANMDQSVKAEEDFFRHVNGGWLNRNGIPAEQSSWGSFNELREYNNEVLLNVLQEAAANEKYAAKSDERKVAVFYETGMDSLKAEKLGVKPLKPMFASIEEINDKQALREVIAEMHQYSIGAFWNFFVYQDLKQSDQQTIYLSQGGLGLPDRDYYLKEGEEAQKLRDQYVKHITKMLELAGMSAEAAAKDAKAIMALETKMAEASMTRVERRNPDATYNKMSLSEINEMSPAIDWNAYLSELGAPKMETAIVRQPEFIKSASELINETAMEDIKAYLKWKTIHAAADYLSYDFIKEDFDFYGKKLSGREEMKPRWKRVLSSTNGSLGEALGKLYVAKVFPPEAKKAAQDMVDNIKVAFGERIKNLEWMSETTKEQALNKLSTFTVKIGYPDKWKGYEGLEINTDSYLGNIMAASRFEFQRDIEKIGQPVDPTEWGMTPPTVNAYYNPVNNEIVFPAGILQPPFYDYKADPALNYGGIGAVIGHEITHGFDDQGRRYDADGNLKDWWTKEDAERFDKRAQKIVEQFNNYEVLDSLNVNGKLTLGENIADLGGLSVAYDGLMRELEKNGNPGEIDGFTQKQRFFMSWANIWRIKMRPAALKQRLVTDSHSPGEFRVNGPLSNIEAFHKAFDINPGDRMYQPDSLRGNIW